MMNGDALLERLRAEKERRISGGIYHELQVRMTYNSNHIEGSRLSEDVKKHYYYRGLKEYEREPGYLMDTCYDGQDTFQALLTYFQIKNP